MSPSSPFDRLRKAIRAAAEDPAARDAVLAVVGRDAVAGSTPAEWLQFAITSGLSDRETLTVSQLGYRDLTAALRIGIGLQGDGSPLCSPLVARLAIAWRVAIGKPAVRRMESKFARFLAPRRK